jgi:tRNA pseudouridine38-40 synthase
MRYFIEFAYKGTHYHGSQIQPNGVTVQSVLQDAFFTILRTPVALTFAGRTDAGVHAKQMFAHFDLDIDPPAAERLNRLLPEDIAVYRIFPVADDLHARFSAVSRTYEYRIATSKSPFTHGARTYMPVPLDYDAMNQAAQRLLGTHDFDSFCKLHTDVKTTICTITQAQWQTNSDGAVFTVTANRFLRNMVRAIVGTLFEVGRHKLSPDDFEAIIASRSRQAAGQSAPAEGLFLTRVVYPHGSTPTY